MHVGTSNLRSLIYLQLCLRSHRYEVACFYHLVEHFEIHMLLSERSIIGKDFQRCVLLISKFWFKCMFWVFFKYICLSILWFFPNVNFRSMIFQIITFVYFKSLNNVHQFFAPMQELLFYSLSRSLKTRSCTQSTASNLIYPDTRNRVKRASTHHPLRNFAIQHHRASETISDTLFLFLHITFAAG